MAMGSSRAAELSNLLRAATSAAGFQLTGIAPAVTPPGFAQFRDWLDRGFAGEMKWIERRVDAYENPEMVLKLSLIHI